MIDIFNDAYINCRFSCIYNLLKQFNLNPDYVVANNYYTIDSNNCIVKNIYYLSYDILFKMLGIKTKKIQLIKSVNDLKLKKEEIAILKIQGKDDTLIGKKEIKSNMIILNINNNYSNLIWRDSSNIKIFKYMKMSNKDIDSVYKKYIDEYYDSDKEPTLSIFSKYKNKDDNITNFFKPQVLMYKLFNTYEFDIKENYKKLKKIFNYNDIDTILKFINKFKKRKITEIYKYKNIVPNVNIVNLLSRQVEILEILGYYLYKNTDKKNNLIDELVNIEMKITNLILNLNASNLFKDIKRYNNKLDIDNLNMIDKYIIKNINIQNNSINGIAYNSHKKYFYKIQNIENYYSELLGYFTIYNYFPISKICDTMIYDNQGVIIYKYERSISSNKGLLSDYFSSNEINCNYKFIDVILKNYETFVYSNKYPMQKLYDERVKTRLEKYYSSSWIDKEFIINNNITIKIKKIIDETKKYFNTNRKYKCVLSHGDLNTMNIGLKPFFMDFMTSGYNCIEAEVALFSISILFIDLFFSPKYHKNSYKNHEKICELIPIIDCDFNFKKNKIYINSKIQTTLKRKNVIEKYIKKIDYNDDNLIYYILMRLLTIFNIDDYEDCDKYYTLFLVIYFYNEMKENKKDFKNIVKEIDTYDYFI